MEIKIRLQDALTRWTRIDREVLALRHFEQLSPAETAEVLGIKEKAAGMRIVRALRRLKEILSSLIPRLAGALTMGESASTPIFSTNSPTSSPSGTAAANGLR